MDDGELLMQAEWEADLRRDVVRARRQHNEARAEQINSQSLVRDAIAGLIAAAGTHDPVRRDGARLQLDQARWIYETARNICVDTASEAEFSQNALQNALNERQTNAMLQATKKLAVATVVLAVATIVLAVSTIVLVVITAVNG